MNDNAQALAIFESMLLIRRFKEAVIDLWATVETEGHRHVYIGQEAVGATIMELLREDDLILTTHRNHGHVLARGADPGRVVVVDDSPRTCGFGAEIVALVAESAFDDLKAPVVRMSPPDIPIPRGTVTQTPFRTTPEKVVGAVRSVLP